MKINPSWADAMILPDAWRDFTDEQLLQHIVGPLLNMLRRYAGEDGPHAVELKPADVALLRMTVRAYPQPGDEAPSVDYTAADHEQALKAAAPEREP